MFWRAEPLLGKDDETDNEYSRCYAKGVQTNTRF
jgi:hypothetical protein